MFGKLLIANRGEIAVRIVRTARRLGIRTVAVFSDPDRNALHVRSADEAVHIGPAALADSYLDAARILDAARRTGAEAIHPGYGFLSENPDFADAVEAASLVFVGPPASAIRAMGLKDAAKRLMEEAGVPVVPGYHGADQDARFLAGEAGRIGYPVLVKARAGGGGKGMRRVDDPPAFPEALEAARREALAAFGDAACLVEKYVSRPRHVEIQVLGDAHGDVVHLFERDCSLQRRHQKVIEEAPAPGMSEEMRAAMGGAAVAAAKAIGYRGAGTVEFIADGSDGLRPDRFFFMEMNTRLQVEHPVTELVTGLDLVELQLRIAAGEPLPFRQEDLTLNGHAAEARLYAEAPARGFLPSTGRLDRLGFPSGVRVDAGVAEGDEVTPFFDPMIAKLVAHGANRREALARLASALRETEIAGLATNARFLGRLAEQPDFVRGDMDTGLIERHFDELVREGDPPPEAAMLGALVLLGAFEPRKSEDPWDRLANFRSFGRARLGIDVDVAGRSHRLAATAAPSVWMVEEGTNRCEIRVLEVGDRPRVEIDGRLTRSSFHRDGDRVTLYLDGETIEIRRLVPNAPDAHHGVGDDRIVSPMPGIVRLAAVQAGDAVAAGAALVVIEAMKMEHTLRAPRDGVVAEVLVTTGDQVGDGTLLLSLEPAA